MAALVPLAPLLPAPPPPCDAQPLFCFLRCAGSSIHGCNICGIEGHQAAHCPNGTVGGEKKWPKEAFALEEPQWYAEPNYGVVAKVAKEWADKRRRQLAGGGAAAGEAAQLAGEDDAGGVPGGGDDAAAHGAGGEGPTSGVGGAAAGVTPPPPGGVWQTYYDALGRPYFFQAATNTTVWALPPGAVALPGVPPVAGAAAGAQQQQMGAGGLVQAQAQAQAHQTVGV